MDRSPERNSALKGAVVGIATAVPTILFVVLEIVNPAGVGFRTAPVALLVAIAVFGGVAGAIAGALAGRARRRRLLTLLGVELASYGVALTAYTAFVILQGTSGPSTLVAMIILWLAIAMVTIPVVVPSLLLGAWVLERWTRKLGDR